MTACQRGMKLSGKRHTAEQIISKLRDKLLNREVFYALE